MDLRCRWLHIHGRGLYISVARFGLLATGNGPAGTLNFDCGRMLHTARVIHATMLRYPCNDAPASLRDVYF